MKKLLNNPFFPFAFWWNFRKWEYEYNLVLTNAGATGMFIALLFVLLFGILRIQG